MSKSSTHSKPFVMVRTLIFSYLLTAVLLLGLAFLMYKCKLAQKQISLGINAIYMVTSLLGGFILAKTFGSRRLIWGVVFGLLYFVVLFGLSMLLNQQIYHGMGHFFLVLGLCSIGGALGGAIS